MALRRCSILLIARISCSVRCLFSFGGQLRFLVLLFPAFCYAQITNVTNDQSVPIPGVGHNYITGINETVNPANGSLSLRIDVPTPPGRGVNLPFHFDYNSGGVIVVTKSTSGQVSQPIVGGGDSGLAESNGWRYSLPVLTAVNDILSNPQAAKNSGPKGTCGATQGYMFSDPGGGRHALGLGLYNQAYCLSKLGTISVNLKYSGGDGDYAASTPSSAPVQVNGLPTGALTITGGDGTIFHYTGLATESDCPATLNCALPDYVEDRNGNTVTFSPSNLTLTAPKYSFFPLTIKDTVGRSSVLISSFGSPSGDTILISGQAKPYSVTWGSEPFNLSVPATLGPSACGNSQIATTLTASGVESVVKSIQLPNGDTYQFSYDSGSGLLNQITYPTGSSVSYVWGPTQQPSDVLTWDQVITNLNGYSASISPNACTGEYNAYAVLQRSVNDGTRVTQIQKFAYATNFSASSKQTTVTTQDMVTTGHPTSTVIYQYSLIAVQPLPFVHVADGSVDTLTATSIPEEQTISYYETNGKLLETVGKTWTGGTPNRVASVTTTQGGETSAVSYQYGAFGSITEEDDSSLGTGGTAGPLLRRTVNTYASYPWDKPCMTKIEDGSGNVFAETDTYFDGGTTLCGAPGATALSAVSGLPAGTHDESNYGPSATTQRGNATLVTQKCLQGCTSSTTAYAYDETGQMVSMTDGCGNATCSDMTGKNHTTTYSYTDSPTNGNPAGNSNAYLTSVTNPLWPSATYQYTYATGQLSQSTDANKQSTNYVYNDPLLRITDIYSPPINGVRPHTNYSYVDGSTPSVTSTDPIGVTQEKLFDGLGHVVHTELLSDPAGIIYVDTSYDGLGRISSTSNPYRTKIDSTYGITQYTYDALNRKIVQTQPDNNTLQWCYNSFVSSPSQTICSPNASSIANSANTSWVDTADEKGQHWQQVSDGLSHLVASMEPDPVTGALALETDYTYDALSNLLSVNQKGSSGSTARGRSFTYNSLSQLLTSTNPETGTICYGTTGGAVPTTSNCTSGYDGNGNLSSKTDARAVTVNYAYDALNRLTNKQSSGATDIPGFNFTYGYDTVNPAVSNGIGRLLYTFTGQGESEQYWYDAMGRMTSQSVYLPSAPHTAVNMSAVYDLAGNMINLTYPDGRTVTSSFDGSGRAKAVTGMWNAASPTQSYFSETNGYDAAGHLVSGAFGNGVQITAGYDSRERIASQAYGLTSAPLWSKQYTWTPNSNMHVQMDSLTGIQRQFGYDTLNRLTSAQDILANAPVANGLNQTYAYDSFGNISQNGSFNSTYTANNQMFGYGYDAAGNLLSNGLFNNYTWDAESRLSSVGGETYIYNADGTRVEKQGSSLTDTVYFGGQPIARLSGGAWTDLIYGPMGLLAEVPGTAAGQPSYRLTDSLGTNVGTLLANGTLTNAIDHTPFGQVISGSTNDPYFFTGKERDTESGLDYFGARYFGSSMGRFQSPDPSGLAFADPTNPQSLNLYAYVRNNPMKSVDPNGLYTTCDGGGDGDGSRPEGGEGLGVDPCPDQATPNELNAASGAMAQQQSARLQTSDSIDVTTYIDSDILTAYLAARARKLIAPNKAPPNNPCPAGTTPHTQRMLVTGYDNSYQSTGKNPGDPHYGQTTSGAMAGPGTIAAPRTFSFGTQMFIPGYGLGTVLDRGGAIRNSHIDLWFPSMQQAINWGAQHLQVTVCR